MRRPPARERGAVMLVLLALLMAVGAALLMHRMNDRAVLRAEHAAATGRALELAKAALIARAATDSNRPGELPCPDYDGDGMITFADLSGSNCRSLVGWLPWNTLDLPELRDGSGARLWYALSDTYHANGTTPLNPDTPAGADLSVDGAGATLLAVVLAPGEALDDQARVAEGAGQADADVAEYLEGENADGDTDFVTAGGADFNDRMVSVTRAELLAAVQRRVTAEVAAMLQRYRGAVGEPDPGHGRYPWLSAFTPPDSANASPSFTTSHGIVAGQLAFTDTETPEPDFDHDSALEVSWTAGNAAVSGPAILITSSDPAEPDVISADAEGLQAESPHFFLQTSQGRTVSDSAEAAARSGSGKAVAYPATPGTGATCTWRGANEEVHCTGTVVEPAGYGVRVCRHDVLFPPPTGPTIGCSGSVLPVSRRYDFQLDFVGDSVRFASDANLRVREVTDGDGSMTVTAPGTAITVTDTVVWNAIPPYFVDNAVITLSWTVTVQDGDSSTITAGRIHTEPQSPGVGFVRVADLPSWFDLAGSDPWCKVHDDGIVRCRDDLPRWFVRNEWYRYLQVSYPPSLGPTGGGVCTPGTDCVSVAANDVAGAVSDAWAVVTSSGELLAGQSRSGATPALAGFEEDNADGNGLTAERKRATGAFNDHVVAVECGPGPTPDPCR